MALRAIPSTALFLAIAGCGAQPLPEEKRAHPLCEFNIDSQEVGGVRINGTKDRFEITRQVRP
ncbi:MAG: hypothetical protein GY811_25970 [Myxococcales bacterium]|nr:hypothetical protein [Myxococcales bacterium]